MVETEVFTLVSFKHGGPDWKRYIFANNLSWIQYLTINYQELRLYEYDTSFIH
jgi:hypothetical protein